MRVWSINLNPGLREIARESERRGEGGGEEKEVMASRRCSTLRICYAYSRSPLLLGAMAAAAAFKLMKSHCVLLLAYIACIVKRRRIKMFGGKKEIGLTWGLVQFVMFFSFLFRSFIICVLV